MRKKILVVDDEPEICEGLSHWLGEVGYEVLAAHNGSEALRKVQLTKPDLVILDVAMPGMDGGTVCVALRDNPQTKDLPIIFLTGLRTKEDQLNRGVGVGGHPIFAKPFDFDELLGTIRELLREKRGQV